MVVVVQVVGSQSFLRLPISLHASSARDVWGAHSGDKSVKNEDVGWPNNCSWHLLALCFAHCNYLWTSSGLEPAFLSFRKLTHPFNSTTVNCSGWYALTETLYVSVWSRHTRSSVFESPLGQVWSFFQHISLWTSANTSFCKIDTAFKLALFIMMWLHLLDYLDMLTRIPVCVKWILLFQPDLWVVCANEQC